MHTHSLKSMLAPMLRLCVAIQNPLNKQWDTYRVIIKIGPYCQYHVKLMNGRVLVRNCRFIRCRVPVTLSRPSGTCPFSVQPHSPASLPTPSLRRSLRLRRPPLCYAEEFTSKWTIWRCQRRDVGICTLPTNWLLIYLYYTHSFITL